MSALRVVLSLLLSTVLLIVGHGMQLTLLPLRAAANGMPELLIGLTASAYFAGFVVGCVVVPRIIARVGHIRCFAVLGAVMISTLLSLEMLDAWVNWLLLRFLTGVAISGLYTVIESWLNSQASAQTRGLILATYTFLTLSAMALGQLLINVGPVESATPFTLAALFMALGIIPVGLTRRMAPAPVSATRVSFRKLYNRSHSAFAGALLSGLVVGSFWSLGAVFADSDGQGQMAVTAFMTAAIVGGALCQYPIGWLSDRRDRRQILVLLTLCSALSSAAVALGDGQVWFLLAVLLFGAFSMPIYAVSLATAADVSSSDEFVEIGTSVLLLNGLGAIFAPILLGQLMTVWGGSALFWSFTVLCLAFSVLFAVLLRQPRAIEASDQTHFKAVASEVAPASFELDPRGEEHAAASPTGEDYTVDTPDDPD
ncbi:MFS transporter [Mangrovimicrobium sediminis]|uniref:MFS transporter n=1 Tax=Mangrovimicrobium sediminis TaxID=2562682 RepID=A0A4Z0LUN5_9GAMM|nr:MFS transporter [Haliea sp. SAOS-164]TGD70989.1 MFS transporter [Haliea sp. SAOS-164]